MLISFHSYEQIAEVLEPSSNIKATQLREGYSEKRHAESKVYCRWKWNQWTEVQILFEAVCVSLRSNDHGKDVNPSFR